MSVPLQMLLSWAWLGFQRCPGPHLPDWSPRCGHLPHLLSDGHQEGASLCRLAEVDLQQPCVFVTVAWVNEVLGG